MTIHAQAMRIMALAGEPWAIHENGFRAALGVFRAAMAGQVPATADLRSRVVTDRFGKRGVENLATLAPRSAPGEFAAAPSRPSIAVVPVGGVLMRYREDVMDSEGYMFGTSYEDVVASVEMAMASPRVEGVMLVIDSPGGLATPAADAFARIRAAREAGGKPLWAVGVDSVYSAALYLAAACDRVVSLPMAGFGAIGSILMVPNMVGQMAADGVRVEVFKSKGAEAKDAGNPYREMTDPDRAQLQAVTDTLGEKFYADLQTGRGATREAVMTWAGRTQWHGPQAVAAGLADALALSVSDAIEQMAEELSISGRGSLGHAAPARVGVGSADARDAKDTAMTLDDLKKMPGGAALAESIVQNALQAAKPAAASIAELKAAFPGDAEFALECAEKGMSLVEARAAFAGVLAVRLDAENKARAEAQAQADKARAELADRQAIVGKLGAAGVRAGHTGVAFAPEQGGAAGTGVEDAATLEGQFNAELDKIITRETAAKRPCDRLKAASILARENPGLHKKYVSASSSYVINRARERGLTK